MPTNIAVVLGHPDSGSLCGAIARAYAEGARAGGAAVREINLGEMNFDPVLRHGYREVQPLEPDLAGAQEAITWSDQVVSQGLHRPRLPARIRVQIPGQLAAMGPAAGRPAGPVARHDGLPDLVLPVGGGPTGPSHDAPGDPRLQRYHTGVHLGVRPGAQRVGRGPVRVAESGPGAGRARRPAWPLTGSGTNPVHPGLTLLTLERTRLNLCLTHRLLAEQS